MVLLLKRERHCMKSSVMDLPGFILTEDEQGHVTTIIILLPYLKADVTLIQQMGKHTSSLCGVLLRINQSRPPRGSSS